MVRIFGWHALNKTEKVLLKVIGEQTGKADITFKEVRPSGRCSSFYRGAQEQNERGWGGR